MIYFYYVFLSIISLPITLLGLILAPILPLFASHEYGWCDNHSHQDFEPRLPKWLSWFMTPDNSLWGDATFITINGTTYWSMVKWLWRNPAYSFALRYLDAPYETTVYGDKTIKDNDNAKEGWCLLLLMDCFSWFALSGFFLVIGVFTSIWVGILGVWWMIMFVLNLILIKPLLFLVHAYQDLDRAK